MDGILTAVISLLVITFPFDPVKILFFGTAISTQSLTRKAAATRTAVYVLVILGVSAVAGRWLLELLGINLDAFRVVGGILIAAMGFEMLYGGTSSKAQGQDQLRRGPTEEDTLLMPLALPLIAGPGAIATSISVSAGPAGITSALLGAAVVALCTFLSFAWLGRFFEGLRQDTIALLARLGGLVLATLGTQMLLGGLKAFFS